MHVAASLLMDGCHNQVQGNDKMHKGLSQETELLRNYTDNTTWAPRYKMKKNSLH